MMAEGDKFTYSRLNTYEACVANYYTMLNRGVVLNVLGSEYTAQMLKQSEIALRNTILAIGGIHGLIDTLSDPAHKDHKAITACTELYPSQAAAHHERRTPIQR
jgi:hypothetical protein